MAPSSNLAPSPTTPALPAREEDGLPRTQRSPDCYAGMWRSEGILRLGNVRFSCNSEVDSFEYPATECPESYTVAGMSDKSPAAGTTARVLTCCPE